MIGFISLDLYMLPIPQNSVKHGSRVWWAYLKVDLVSNAELFWFSVINFSKLSKYRSDYLHAQLYFFSYCIWADIKWAMIQINASRYAVVLRYLQAYKNLLPVLKNLQFTRYVRTWSNDSAFARSAKTRRQHQPWNRHADTKSSKLLYMFVHYSIIPVILVL